MKKYFVCENKEVGASRESYEIHWKDYDGFEHTVISAIPVKEEAEMICEKLNEKESEMDNRWREMNLRREAMPKQNNW